MMSVVCGEQPSIQNQNQASTRSSTDYAIECREVGVYLHAPQSQEHELCVNNYCVLEKTPPIHKLIRLPPEEMIHDFEVRWKLKAKDSYTVVETTCPAQSFCSAIDCTVCTANVLNPECWPLAAITGLGIILYLLVAICYTICYVPVTVGRPFRIMLKGIRTVASLFGQMLLTCLSYVTGIFKRGPRQRSSRIMEALAVVAAALAIGALACQEVNCECTPAENQVMCKCEEDEVEKTFMSIENALPVIRDQVQFSKHPHHAVIAKIEHDVSAEFTLTLKEAATDLITEIKEDICTIENADITGCYLCSKGARAKRMSSSKQEDEFTRKRQAQERKLIDEIKYKRSCVRLASTFPSEEDIQKKIRRFVKSILLLVKSNSLSEAFAELRGTKPKLFASMEATLYKSRLEKLHLEACYTCERIRSTAEALSMAYEVYGLLVLSDDKVADSRDRFYDKEEQGVAMEPNFTADFIRKELDFLADLKHQVEHEIREAQLQEESERHASPLDAVKELISSLRKEQEEQHMELLRKIDGQNETIKEMSERLESLSAAAMKIQEDQEHPEDLLSKGQAESMQGDRESVEKAPSEHVEEPVGRDTASEEPEEDLLDLMDDYEFDVAQDDAESDRSERRSPQPVQYPGNQARIELERRIAEIRAYLNENRAVPERCIRQVDKMRDQRPLPDLLLLSNQRDSLFGQLPEIRQC
ncbi:hypothetical protein OSTOST_06725 [Ostertagia ostertagi]